MKKRKLYDEIACIFGITSLISMRIHTSLWHCNLIIATLCLFLCLVSLMLSFHTSKTVYMERNQSFRILHYSIFTCFLMLLLLTFL